MSLIRQLAESDAAKDMIMTILWVVGSLSFIVFIALFGRLPVFRRTPIGWMHRLLLQSIPNALIRIDAMVTGRRVTHTITRLYDYLMYDRHPVVLIIFVILQLGSEGLFIPPAARFLPAYHKYALLPVLITLPYLFLYLCYITEGHHINAQTYSAALNRYPYDHTLYHPHIPCRTCHRPKPARSKHCPICKTCIERQDHHCIWINNCVGLHNYHYFVALLVAVSMLLGYGVVMGLRILEAILQNAFVPSELIRGSYSAKRWSTGLTWAEWLNVYSVCIASNPRIGAVTLLACTTCPLAIGFLVYHVYLTWAGATTNETAKWTELKEDIWDDLVWKARIDEVKAEYPGPLDERIVYDAEHFKDQSKMRGRLPSWSKRAEWWIVRTRGGMHPLRATQDGGEEIDSRWRRIRSMKEVDNVYDQGIRRNAKDLLLRPLKVPE